MVILKLKLVRGNTADDAAADANVIVPIGYVNHGGKVFKESVEPWALKGERVVAADCYFDYIKY